MPGNRSALVWMERRQRAEEVMKLSDEDAATEIQLTTHGELGLISNVGPRRAFSMQGLVARCFAARRTILIGEAAHVVPPIGAQGLNMSLRDAAQAAEIISFADDPGGSEALTEYDALRRRDVQPRLHAIDLMNRSLLADFLPMAAGRMLGLALISSFGPLRQFVMRQGLAPEGSLPLSMRDQGQLHPEPR
jgi:2-octaprenyl-6-methoxyphenol hydroxylase